MSLACCFLQTEAVEVILCPWEEEGGGAWNYYPDCSTLLTHHLLQVCCLSWMPEVLNFLFVPPPPIIYSLPGNIRLSMPVKHAVQRSHPHPLTLFMYVLNWDYGWLSSKTPLTSCVSWASAKLIDRGGMFNQISTKRLLAFHRHNWNVNRCDDIWNCIFKFPIMLFRLSEKGLQ